MKKTFISAAAVFAFAAAGHADELSDIQAQSKQLREQNQALTRRLGELEKRQRKLEKQPAVASGNPADAMAADLSYKAAVKAQAPVNDDLCWHGVCLYGNFDMGLSYQNHGSPITAFPAGALDYMVERTSNGAFFGIGADQMSASFLGLRGKQEIADNLYAVFNLQTLFNPESGMNSNGLATMVQNNGYGAVNNLQSANSFGDSSKVGQMFNAAAYFGISSPTYGTFTMGRQSAMSSDNIVNYDPISNSNAWSVLAYEGATAGGGSTENRVYDNSLEYRVNVGPVRLAVEAQLRNGGNSATGNAIEGDIGFDYAGLSMDFLGGKTTDSLAVGTVLTATQQQSLASLPFGCSSGCITGTVSDNTVFQAVGKYTIGPWKIYGGYEHIQYANPNNPLSQGAFVEGGYTLAFVNNANYTSDRVLQIFWAGVKYSITRDLDVMGAYYGERQNSYMNTANPTGTCTNATASSCSGQLDTVSLVFDWRFARHFDLYAGVMYSQKSNGFVNGYILSSTNASVASTFNTYNRVSAYDPGIGLRYSF